MTSSYAAGSDAPAGTAALPATPQGRPFRHLCSEADYRDSLTDEEFWDHVARSLAPPRTWDYGPSVIDLEDMADLAHLANPCPECGTWGACAYDAEGRALIHVTTEDDT